MFLVASQCRRHRSAGHGEPHAAPLAAAAARRRLRHLPGVRREQGRTYRLQGAVLRAQRGLPRS